MKICLNLVFSVVAKVTMHTDRLSGGETLITVTMALCSLQVNIHSSPLLLASFIQSIELFQPQPNWSFLLSRSAVVPFFLLACQPPRDASFLCACYLFPLSYESLLHFAADSYVFGSVSSLLSLVVSTTVTAG